VCVCMSGAKPVNAQLNDELGHWEIEAPGMVALIVVLDQFSRHIHRDNPTHPERLVCVHGCVSEFVIFVTDCAVQVPVGFLVKGRS
jgi:uncharacterized protein (DUF924 family)